MDYSTSSAAAGLLPCLPSLTGASSYWTGCLGEYMNKHCLYASPLVVVWVEWPSILRGGYRATEGGGNFTRLCTMRMRKRLTTPTFSILSWMTTMPRQKIMVLSSEIIEIIAKSPHILCIFCILWTKGRSLVQGGNYWAWRGGECALYSPPLDPPLILKT